MCSATQAARALHLLLIPGEASLPFTSESADYQLLETMDAPIHTLVVSVPFESSTHASIALQVLGVDSELQPHAVERIFELDANILNAKFTCATVRLARLTVNAYLENIDLILRTFVAFGGDAALAVPEH